MFEGAARYGALRDLLVNLLGQQPSMMPQRVSDGLAKIRRDHSGLAQHYDPLMPTGRQLQRRLMKLATARIDSCTRTRGPIPTLGTQALGEPAHQITCWWMKPADPSVEFAHQHLFWSADLPDRRGASAGIGPLADTGQRGRGAVRREFRSGPLAFYEIREFRSFRNSRKPFCQREPRSTF
jgi:hypothetical protein